MNDLLLLLTYCAHHFLGREEKYNGFNIGGYHDRENFVVNFATLVLIYFLLSFSKRGVSLY